jgi:hypothetical protein
MKNEAYRSEDGARIFCGQHARPTGPACCDALSFTGLRWLADRVAEHGVWEDKIFGCRRNRYAMIISQESSLAYSSYTSTLLGCFTDLR